MAVDLDVAIKDIVPDGAVVVGAITVVLWLDPETGDQVWRCWCDVDAPVTTSLGLLELGKLDIIARSETGIPLTYDE